MFFALALQILALCLFFTADSFALLANVTVDDQLGDPLTLNKIVYSPASEWNFGPTCRTCSAHPDPSQTSSGTWHDTYQFPGSENDNKTLTASYSFMGSHVYVQCVIALSSTNPPGRTEMTFFLDEEEAGTFLHEVDPVQQTGFLYHVTVFSKEFDFEDNHTITVQNRGQTHNQSLLLLDSIIYSYNDDTQSSPGRPPTHHSKVAALAGGIVGSLLGLMLCGVSIFLLRRRSRGPKPILALDPFSAHCIPSTSGPARDASARKSARVDDGEASVELDVVS
ncbi:hypothetical protein BDZ89DRAFT_535080 [Hymenopellis radicata]|nr:hypothetical protein BDZ89DRAFT_535080 [Hymenopellis radicata]